MISRRHLLGLAAAGAVALRAGVGRAAPTTVPIFLYPPSHRYPDGRTLTAMTAFDVAQITTRFALPPEMAGVSLSFYWSTLSAKREALDFSMIDAALDYWGRRGKKVIVSVATIGYPAHAGASNGPLRTATPDWVLDHVATYRHATRVTGAVGEPDAELPFPDFRDPRFLDLSAELVRKLGRYDGHPAVAQWRISTGLQGEDNPLVGPIAGPMAGYDEEQWLAYCRRAVVPFFEAFRRTQLCFDIGRLSGMAGAGGPAAAAHVQSFLDTLRAHRVLLAFDGLSGDSLDGLRNPRAGLHPVFAHLQRYEAQGGPIGLEALGPLFNPRMANVDAIVEVVEALRPQRLVLFGDVAPDLLDPAAANRPGAAVARRLMALLAPK